MFMPADMGQMGRIEYNRLKDELTLKTFIPTST